MKEAILVNGVNIAQLEIEISQIEDRIYSENDALEYLLERKKEIEKIADEREKKHQLNEINTKIEDSNTKIKKKGQNKKKKKNNLQK